MYNEKIKLVFDSTTLLWNIDKNLVNRSGLFFVAYNIAKLFLQKEEIEIYFYIQKRKYKLLKKCLKITFPNNKINIITENLKIWFDIDSFYSPLYSVPIFIEDMKYVKKYITLHDAIYNIFPEIYDDKHIIWYKVLLKSINKEDYYFSVSENTKKDFIKYATQINPNNIFVVPLGIKDNLKPLTINKEILKKYNINKRYIFSLCALNPRKNLIKIIRSFFKFLEKNNIDDMVFVLGGPDSEDFLEKFNSEISEYKDKIIKIGYVADEDLPYLYSGAEWFVYTSQYEGFGLPPLEAMACGCPVIVSNNSSLPEVVGDAGIMIDYDSDEQHIEAYEKYYFNEEYRKEMVKKCLERSKLFSWDKCVNEMLKVMKNNLDTNIKNKVRFIKTEDLIYYKIFGLFIVLPRLKTIFSVGKSEDERFTILTILGMKISIKVKNKEQS
ncbi:glycosyltransferase family 1 protein [Brachyspira aalborgi]|uniref:Glycosyltransferase family 1 protein n=1 Tax=Brachyspira aalborgi TaxID=29522 RepID=A0A5C8F1P3_9SPIR|nr:glycosyltransferase family 1 protein [Brachyspira aalborgi]TXJ44175.1 glycosyltransferase family 1 protein [Brachyspira aalborgi]